MRASSEDLDRTYYQRRYDEEIARSIDAADMTSAMVHRRLAARYAAVLGSGISPGLISASDDDASSTDIAGAPISNRGTAGHV